ncbi:ATP-grasp domain-containing protein [Actinokineospora sp.]|uniref:ATP-grasp domain-containing protein n=1 Tax=Actinokineospora sp. TaxID=1872133 RepID=UPI00403796DE
MQVRKSVAMVDVYAPTMRLMRGFADAGYDVVRVQSTAEIPPAYRPFDADGFADNIVHYGQFDKTLEAVAKHEPVAVFTGGELGIELADQLSEALGLATNGTTQSEARRNKFAQAEACRAAGVPAARQLLVSDADELAAWHRSVGGRAVVKPIRSMGNDGVTFCDTPAESAAAYRALTGSLNTFGIRNEGVVAQEYLFGVEYAVDTVSCQGRHRVTDLWQYNKIGVNGVVDRMCGHFTIPADAEVRTVLGEYAGAVLDALGVRFGPAHLEIMLTPDGPRLVEGGFRIAGADVPYYAALAAGESQITWSVDAYLNPERFLAQYQRPFRLTQHVAMVFPTSPVEGVLRSYPLLDQVRELASFHDVRMHYKPGDYLPKTVDNGTEPLIIGLVHPRAEVIAHDMASINYLDGPGFYDVEPTR